MKYCGYINTTCTKCENQSEFTFQNFFPPIKMPYYSRKRTYYRKKRTYKRKGGMVKKRTYTKRRRTYRRSSDTGTYLKISSGALPVVIENKSAPSPNLTLSPDTFQGSLRFLIGDTASGETIIINNEMSTTTTPNFAKRTNVYLGSSDFFSKYAALYKYMQVYKIVVKFTPTITEGGIISTAPGQYYTNAINGSITTDQGIIGDGYFTDYPADLEGQSRANSRKVSRVHSLIKGWTRTFVPKRVIREVVTNPKSKYQYKPEYDLTTRTTQTFLCENDFIFRMRKPQLAGFTATTIEGTEVDFPELGSLVRYGTLNVHAYVKFRTPIY